MSTTTLDAPATNPVAPQPTSSPLAVALRTVGIALAAALVAWAAVQAADWAASSEGEERVTFGAAATVELVADGSVTVRAGDSGSVEVRREWREGLLPVSFDAVESGGRLVVSHDCAWFSTACHAGLDVTLPADANVVVRASDGRIEVAGIAGDLAARTGSGSIAIERVGGDVVARTGSGKVVALGVDGDTELRTGSGSIEAGQIGGSLEAHTGSGSIEVDQITGSLEARSGSGRIEVRDVGGEAFAHTSSGNVFVAAVMSNIDAHTSSGRVTVHGNGTPVALAISTSSGRQTVEAPTDPAAPVKVKIRSSSGAVEYLGPLS